MATDNKDVFGIDTRIGGAWSLDGALIELEGGDKLVVTSIDITYSRQSQKFSPLNQAYKYIAVGEADGTLEMGLIIGPHAEIKNFLSRYSDACEVKKNTITVKPTGLRYSAGGGGDCGSGFAALSFVCTGVLINNIRISIRQSGGNLTVLNAGLGMQFVSLKVGPNSSGNSVE